jgi:hypothetical protein
MIPHALDERFGDPAPTKGVSEEAAKFGDYCRFGSVRQIGKAVHLEIFEEIDIQLAEVIDALALAIFLEAAKVKLILAVRELGGARRSTPPRCPVDTGVIHLG